MLARYYRARAAAFLLSLCTAGSFSSSRKAAVARGVQRPSTWLGLGSGVGLGLGLGLALALGLKLGPGLGVGVATSGLARG